MKAPGGMEDAVRRNVTQCVGRQERERGAAQSVVGRSSGREMTRAVREAQCRLIHHLHQLTGTCGSTRLSSDRPCTGGCVAPNCHQCMRLHHIRRIPHTSKA
jgi:hypothetical protein